MTTTNVNVAVPAPPHRHPSSRVPGLVVIAVGLGCALLGNWLVPQVGVLTWAVALGVAAANLNLLPSSSKVVLGKLTKKLLRAGVTLLGFSVSLGSITALGAPIIAVVAGTLLATLLFTSWLGIRMRLGVPRSLLIGTGVAICGASAIAVVGVGQPVVGGARSTGLAGSTWHTSFR